MANYNRVILIGRLTRDVETKTFGNGGKVANFGFVVNGRKKGANGQWEDEPMFIDVAAFNRGETGTLANIVEQYCRKGSQICIEGQLRLETWDDKQTGAKRSKHKIIADSVQLLDPKPDGGGGDSRPAARQERQQPAAGGYDAPPPDGGNDDSIPF